MRLLFRLLSLLPLGFAHALGWCLGWLAFGVSGVYRKRFLDHARQAQVAASQWRKAVGESGKMIAELPRLWTGRPVNVVVQGAQHVENALAKGKGLIFLTPHLGCFEITALTYAARFGVAQRPLTVLFRPPRQPWLRDLFAHSRNRAGMQAAPTTLAGVRQLVRALRMGHAVGLLPDQVPPQGQGVWLPFFGRNAYTTTLAARLALQTGATVLLTWGERLAWGAGYTVHVCPLGQDLPNDTQAATQHINCEMELLVRQCPAQYLWGYARYKQPRSEAPGEADAP